jgi:hypothetical protein
MLSNYVGNAGTLTREVGRTYWKKAMGDDYSLDIYNNKVYMDFHGDPGFYMYKFPNGPKTINYNYYFEQFQRTIEQLKLFKIIVSTCQLQC